MPSRVLSLLCVLALSCSLATPSAAGRRATPSVSTTPSRASVFDLDRRLDANRMSLVVTNLGSLGYDISVGNGGHWYPADSSTMLLFASGLWLGAVVGGAPRVTVAEYSMEYTPGRMSGTVPGSPTAPENRVWKVKRWTGDPQDSAHVERGPGGGAVDPLVHHSWSEYMAMAAPTGAPWRLHRLADTTTADPSDSVDVPGPDVMGDQMTWCVFNDADPAAHTNGGGSTVPLGAEVEQTVFAFDDPGPLGDVAFIRWRVHHRGLSTWENLRAGFWADPDIGASSDDKVGCDTTRSVGFAYNGRPNDLAYGDHPPVLGTVLLFSSPNPNGGDTPGMHTFTSYVNGTDPNNAPESYASLSGYLANGSGIFDPNGDVTRYMFSGDPLTGTGWLDPVAADKRMLASFAPRHMEPGDSLELWAAIVVSPGTWLPQALAELPCRTDYVRAAFASGFARPFPPAAACGVPLNCPRSAAYWATQCAGTGGYPSPTLDSLAQVVDQGSVALDFGLDAPAAFCSTLTQGSDVRTLAKREFASLLANVFAAPAQLQPVGEMPVALLPSTPVNCPGVNASDVGGLTTLAASERTVSGAYKNLVTTNRRPIEGVDFGMSGFGGGAGAAYYFLGSSLDPIAQPDSFPARVLIAFNQFQSQKAYRYLRNQLPDGSLPSVGRGYRYAGFVNVPFSVRDSATGELLDVAFVEKVVTDDLGTIQPATSQPASFDSAWAPTTDPVGDREYLSVSRRPYTGAARSEFAVDAALTSSDLPWLYSLAARRRAESDVFDDGDEFAFRFDYASTPGVDAVLRDLEGLSLSDPSVEARYAEIANCLGAINRGETVGTTCDEPTPVLGSLVSAEAEPGLVRIEWSVSTNSSVTVERSEQGYPWADLATLQPDGDGRIVIADRDVQAGASYSYRLRIARSHLGEVTLDVPSQHRLSLSGFRPNPASGALAVAFTLASSVPAQLEVLDVAGRRLYQRVIERPVAGLRVLPLAGVRLAPGVYVVRLTQGSEQLVARGVVLH